MMVSLQRKKLRSKKTMIINDLQLLVEKFTVHDDYAFCFGYLWSPDSLYCYPNVKGLVTSKLCSLSS